MKVTLAVVTSVNGKITSNTFPTVGDWTSHEDKKHFKLLIKNNSLIIMGRKTYQSAKGFIKHTPGKLRVVLTRHPDRYEKEKIDGQLEFTNKKPLQIIDTLTKLGYKKALLVGGSQIYGLFVAQKLVDEMCLTIEPIIIRSGKNAYVGIDELTRLQLIRTTRLNKEGTLLLHYKFLYSHEDKNDKN